MSTGITKWVISQGFILLLIKENEEFLWRPGGQDVDRREIIQLWSCLPFCHLRARQFLINKAPGQQSSKWRLSSALGSSAHSNLRGFYLTQIQLDSKIDQSWIATRDLAKVEIDKTSDLCRRLQLVNLCELSGRIPPNGQLSSNLRAGGPTSWQILISREFVETSLNFSSHI